MQKSRRQRVDILQTPLPIDVLKNQNYDNHVEPILELRHFNVVDDEAHISPTSALETLARAFEKIRIDIGKCYVVSIDRRGWNVVQKLRRATANDQQIGLLVMPVRRKHRLQ